MRTLLIGLAVALAACTTTDVKQRGEKYDPRPANWPIAMYASSEAPREVSTLSFVRVGKPPGKSIASIKVREPMANREYDFSFSTAKSLARQLGGDSLYITGGKKFGTSTTMRHELRMTVYRHND